jgi:NifU-like protein involved in Fe-S cluster formation
VSKRLENVFGYSAAIWKRFADPQHVGVFETGDAHVAVAGTPASKSVLRLGWKVDGGQIVDARFQAYGCPVTIAVGEWLAEQSRGAAIGALARIDAAKIRAALEIGDDRAHCALLGQDVVRALLDQTSKQVLNA